MTAWFRMSYGPGPAVAGRCSTRAAPARNAFLPGFLVTALRTALAVTATLSVVLGVPAAPAGAAAVPPGPLTSGHVSVSAVSGSLPVGATVSVVQLCPAGSALDRAATREAGLEADQELDGRVRLASREFWRAGTVSRYRVTRAVAAASAVPLLNAALCTSPAVGGATTVSGRAATDLRVWGPAPSRLEVVNATIAVVTDDPDADEVFATVMAAGGVAIRRVDAGRRHRRAADREAGGPERRRRRRQDEPPDPPRLVHLAEEPLRLHEGPHQEDHHHRLTRPGRESVAWPRPRSG